MMDALLCVIGAAIMLAVAWLLPILGEVADKNLRRKVLGGKERGQVWIPFAVVLVLVVILLALFGAMGLLCAGGAC
jgi:MFS-type transporter involved in bile tolerance (Atg22 family)